MALLSYLKTTPLPLPEVTRAPTGELQPGFGTVTPSFKRGEMFLSNSLGKAFRLEWNGEETEAERARVLPAGQYKLGTYRIVRVQEGERWHVSGTRSPIKTVQVRSGNNTLVQVDDTIKLRSSLRGSHAMMSIKGDGGSGLSIYREGNRIPIRYSIQTESGRVLTSGTMRYG